MWPLAGAAHPLGRHMLQRVMWPAATHCQMSKTNVQPHRKMDREQQMDWQPLRAKHRGCRGQALPAVVLSSKHKSLYEHNATNRLLTAGMAPPHLLLPTSSCTHTMDGQTDDIWDCCVSLTAPYPCLSSE